VGVLIKTGAEHVNIAVMDNLEILNNAVDDALY